MDFFAKKLVAWQKKAGRHHLPWQKTTDAYRIWVSEIMLQQTQVATVIPYYEKFLSFFPTVSDLANASLEEVLKLWSGLGYYTRARNLHRAAQMVGDVFPTASDELMKLPGIGRSTAAAIAVFSVGEKAAILDGNVMRVFSRVFHLKSDISRTKTKNELWDLAEKLLPKKEIKAYTQGLMDLGATLCTPKKPDCKNCPFEKECLAHQKGIEEEIPFKKKKEKLPLKKVIVPVLVSKGEVLLEKRPLKGIWGGLLSLPECESERKLQAFIKAYRVKDKKELREIKHTFSHYKLLMRPILFHVEKKEGLWVKLNAIENESLPSPIKKLLLTL